MSEPARNKSRRTYSPERLQRIADRLGLGVDELLLRLAQKRPRPPAGTHVGNGLSLQGVLGLSEDTPADVAIWMFTNQKIHPGLAKTVADARYERLAREEKSRSTSMRAIARKPRQSPKEQQREALLRWLAARKRWPSADEALSELHKTFGDSTAARSTVAGWLKAEKERRKGV